MIPRLTLAALLLFPVLSFAAEPLRLHPDNPHYLQFRGKDYATDVLSFPAEPSDARHLGDLAISTLRARAQAREFGHSTEDELRILMLHGVLHLLGHDHETDRGRMARVESRWRKELGLPNGLIERAQS